MNKMNFIIQKFDKIKKSNMLYHGTLASIPLIWCAFEYYREKRYEAMIKNTDIDKNSAK